MAMEHRALKTAPMIDDSPEAAAAQDRTASPDTQETGPVQMLVIGFEDGKFSGAILVARGTDVWFEGAYVFANRGDRVANTVETRFNIGSFNKPSGVGEADCDSVEHALCRTRNDVEM